jgi:hypothetical protein
MGLLSKIRFFPWLPGAPFSGTILSGIILTGAILSLSVAVPTPARAGAVLVTIAVEGQAAPDANGTIGSISDVSLNDAGQVVFNSSLMQGTAGGAADNSGIFRGTGGSLTQIAREGNAAPGGGGGAFGSFNNIKMNSSGQVAFTSSSMTGTSGGTANDRGVFSGDGGAITEIAREGDTAPDANGTLSNFGNVGIRDDGQVAFVDFTIQGTSGGFADNSGIFRGSSTAQLVREGQAAPGAGGGLVGSTSNVQFNEAGQVAFESFGGAGTSGGAANDNGVFLRETTGTLTEIAREGDAAPDANGTLASINQVRLNKAGQVAFSSSSMAGTAGGTSDNSGVFRGDGGALIQVAREGGAAPGAAGGTFGNSFSSIDINDAGQVLFSNSFMQGTANGTADDSGVFRDTGGALSEIAREGQATGNGTMGLTVDAIMNQTGQIAFETQAMLGTAGGTTDDKAIFIGDGQDTVELVRKGDAFEGSTVSTLNITTDGGGINKFGQVAVDAILSDGRDVAILATPEIHWRNAGSSLWDTGDNWTLGLNPGDPHDVFIDATNTTTVTGPAADVTINALQVGGGAGFSTLRLNQGGNLTVTGDLDITTNGTLDQDVGTLAVGGNVTNTRTFRQDGGTMTVAGTFSNFSSATVSGAIDVTGGMTNSSFLTLNGGTISGGAMTNDFGASMSAAGTIDADFNNNGTLNLTGFLSATGATVNIGTVNAGLGDTLLASGGTTNIGTVNLTGGNLGGGVLTNSGTVTLSNGGAVSASSVTNQSVIQGAGVVASALSNSGGLIHANVSGSSLTLTNLTGNTGGGELRVAEGASINVVNAFASSGTVDIQGPNAVLLGGAITNTGTMRGQGRVQNTVLNSGTLRTQGGNLTLSGAGNTNTATGVIEVADTTEMIVSQGLATNAGTIALTGGRFDNNNIAMTNSSSGIIAGRGTVATGGLTNAGAISLANGNTDMLGTLQNDLGATVDINSATVTFFNTVTNDGTVTSNLSTVSFLGGFVNNGTLITDPNVINFTDFTNNDPASVIAFADDEFIVSNDVLGDTSNNLVWDTDEAILRYVAGVDSAHTMQLYGIDLGASVAGLVNNFAWGTVDLTSGQTVSLEDIKADGESGALYLDTILLADFAADIIDGVLDAIIGNGLNVYYNALAAGNGFLGGLNYDLQGGGQLIAFLGETATIAEPSSIALFLAGLLGLFGHGRAGRRRAG